MVAWHCLRARGCSSGLHINFHSAMMDILEHFSISSLLRPALAQVTPLKNKLLARLKLVAFSSISFHVVQVSTGSSSVTEKNSTISFRLWSSDWWKVMNSFSNGKSSGLLFSHVGVTTCFQVRKKWLEVCGLWLTTNVGFPRAPRFERHMILISRTLVSPTLAFSKQKGRTSLVLLSAGKCTTLSTSACLSFI